MQPNKLIHRQLKSILALKGITQKEIADSLGMTRQNVHLVMTGRVKNEKVREELCRITGLRADELWPSN